jgi:hypothetical protein
MSVQLVEVVRDCSVIFPVWTPQHAWALLGSVAVGCVRQVGWLGSSSLYIGGQQL